MKKVTAITILLSQLIFNGWTQHLNHSLLPSSSGTYGSFISTYNYTTCGLNFTQASILLGKKMAPYGYPFYGVDQPASLVISGIPLTAKIEKAFVWWDLSGNDTLTGKVILKNPGNFTDTFPGQVLGKGPQYCWGKGATFRAEVTKSISGNGIYSISGLPTDSTFTKSDVNGATLLIIYSDTTASYSGILIIYDGSVIVYNDTVTQIISPVKPIADTSYGKGFIIASDLQNESGNAMKFNNGAFIGVQQDYWDYEEKATVFTKNQGSSTFGLRAPNDCSNWIAMGIYIQTPMTPLIPVITRNGDTLIASAGNKFLWYLNDTLIPGAVYKKYLSKKSGKYRVGVSDSLNCYYTSVSDSILLCKEKIKPNISDSAGYLRTDSVSFTLQWYLNGSSIPGATASNYKALVSGKYFVKAKDNFGCNVNSDTLNITVIGTEEYFSGSGLILFPNPSNGIISIDFLKGNPVSLSVHSLSGQTVWSLLPDDVPNARVEINLSNLSDGLYFLSAVTEQGTFHSKIIIRAGF